MDGTTGIEQQAAVEAAPAKKKSPYIKSRGMKFPKNRAFVAGQTRGALREGVYEPRETKSVLAVVREGDTVMHLGAGFGYLSTLVATKRKIAAVHCFEANPTLIPYIESVHAANGVTNATITNAALGKRKGTSDFYLRKNYLSSSLSQDGGSSIVSTDQVEVLNARTVMRDLKPTVLICTIEGGEAELIPELDLKNLRAAIIALHPEWIGPKGVNAVFEAMSAAGLAYYARASSQKVVAFRRNW